MAVERLNSILPKDHRGRQDGLYRVVPAHPHTPTPLSLLAPGEIEVQGGMQSGLLLGFSAPSRGRCRTGIPPWSPGLTFVAAGQGGTTNTLSGPRLSLAFLETDILKSQRQLRERRKTSDPNLSKTKINSEMGMTMEKQYCINFRASVIQYQPSYTRGRQTDDREIPYLTASPHHVPFVNLVRYQTYLELLHYGIAYKMGHSVIRQGRCYEEGRNDSDRDLSECGRPVYELRVATLITTRPLKLEVQDSVISKPPWLVLVRYYTVPLRAASWQCSSRGPDSWFTIDFRFLRGFADYSRLKAELLVCDDSNSSLSV
uniref:Uncharacterized protein n=1 Tax=Timema tahoe TaxID=61484 RepID=A0A7R9FGX0_9NEOP|nr:unnamed protein product [Timema tahoe]